MFFFRKVKNKLFPSVQAKRVKPWFKVNGDKTLRLNYDLNEKSIVFDLGGYEGQWASDIFSKYLPTIYVFEPFIPYANEIVKRFQKNTKVKVFSFGLGDDNKDLTIYEDADGTSTFRGSGPSHTMAIKKASAFLIENGIQRIDLMKINIEGGEYELLEELINSGFVKNIHNIQIQFHDFVPQAKDRMNAIQKKLAQTHHTTYQFEFVWENWTLTS